MRAFHVVIGIVTATCLMQAAFAQVPVVGGGGASLSSIAGSDTLVTVVLKGAGVEDPNLKVVSVEGGILSVATSNGITTSYRLQDVQEVRVQGEVIPVQDLALLADRGLNSDQQKIVDAALARASKIYNESAGDQNLKMWAAEVLAAGGPDEKTEKARTGELVSKQAAAKYLTDLAGGNDIRTALRAAMHLYNAGLTESLPALVQQGMTSGDRMVKATSAQLAGLIREESVRGELRRMVQDRAANISAPAALALARMGDRDIIPTLIAMLGDLNEEKSGAAVYALTMLGGQDLIDQLRLKLGDAEGPTRFRIAKVLTGLGDPKGMAVLRDESMAIPSSQVEAAILLAKKNDVKSLQFLREWLMQAYPLNTEATSDQAARLKMQRDVQRARAAAALIQAGDRTNAGVFQELLRAAPGQVQIEVLQLLAALDVHALLPMTQPLITGEDANLAIVACKAAVAMASNTYRDQLRLASLDY